MTRKENQNLPVKPETSNSTSSTNMLSRSTNTRIDQFFPCSSNESDPPPYSPTESCYSLPPPYPTDEPSGLNLPLPYPSNGSTKVKVIPPYPIDPTPRGQFLTFCPQNSIGLETANEPSIVSLVSTNCSKSLGNNAPTAPLVGEIGFKAGLMAFEREEITEALSTMKRNVYWKTTAEEAAFSDAEEKVLELLFAAESNLTESEKEEIALQVRNINKLRRDWITREMEKRRNERREREKSKGEKRRNADIALVTLKITELILDNIILFSADVINYNVFLTVFSILTISITGVFLLLYVCCDNIRKLVFAFDSLFCFFFALGYFLLSVKYELSISLIARYIVTVLYFIEVCFKYSLMSSEDFPQNRSNVEVSHSIPNTRTHGSTASRIRTYIPTYYSIRNERVHTAYHTTDDYNVQDLPAGVDYTLNLNHVNHTSHLLDLLNDRGSDDQDNEGGFRDYGHNVGDSGEGGSESKCHDSSNNIYDGNHTTTDDCNGREDYSAGGNDYSSGYTGGCDYSSYDYSGGDSGGGDYGGGDSGGGDSGGCDSGGGSCD